MTYQTLEVTVISAQGLNKVNLFTRMVVYAMAMIIDGDARSKTRKKKKTPVDKEGGRNPTWNKTLKFNVMDFGADQAVLHIVLKSERVLGDREIGAVYVPIRELLDQWNKAVAAAHEKKSTPPAQSLSYQVRKHSGEHSGKAKGVLNLSYMFSDFVTVPTPSPPQFTAGPASTYTSAPFTAHPPSAGPAYPPPHDTKAPSDSNGFEPVTAYPAAAGASTAYPPPGAYPYEPRAGYGYPPPPQAGYGYPPHAGYPAQQPGYGYPPQQPGYGYPQQQPGYGYPTQQGGYGYGAPPQAVQPQKGKSKLGGGAGLGIGLVGGALGGMILGDMMSDACSYDAGYDAGFDDGFDDGGFDF